MVKLWHNTTYFSVEAINIQRKIRGKNWSRGTNSRLPFGVNVNLNLSCVTRTFHVLVVQNGIHFVVVQNNGKEMYKKFTARAICFFAN